jgi:hypothetical protein
MTRWIFKKGERESACAITSKEYSVYIKYKKSKWLWA